MGNDISVLVQRMINIIDYKAKINGAESYDKADALRDLKIACDKIDWEEFEDTFDHRLTTTEGAADVSIFAQIEKMSGVSQKEEAMLQLMDVVMSNDTILDLINVL